MIGINSIQFYLDSAKSQHTLSLGTLHSGGDSGIELDQLGWKDRNWGEKMKRRAKTVSSFVFNTVRLVMMTVVKTPEK